MVATLASTQRGGSSPRLDSPAGGEEDEAYELPSDYKPYVPVAKRRAQLLAQLGGKHQAKRVKTTEEIEDEVEVEDDSVAKQEEREREKARRERTLLQAAQEVKEKKEKEDASRTAAERDEEEETRLLAEMERGQKKLAGAKEIAEGKTWTDSLKTSWRAPWFIRQMTEEEHEAVREKNHIICAGDDLPPPITNFTVSRLFHEQTIC